ncbi:MAG: RNA recognition motif domain-containing protein [Symbiobacteriia bacterium]
MSKTLYVGNLPWATTEADLTQLFAQYGTVHSARIVSDRETNRSRGFGFVEVADEAAENMVQQTNGATYGDRALTVNEAHERQPRSAQY